MPAYAKVALVTPVFHQSDMAFARAWSQAAPGIGGWNVLVDRSAAPEQVSVVPPGGVEPVFFASRSAGKVALERKRADDNETVEIGMFEGLREALLALCPLTDEALEEIQTALEREFPRRNR